MSLPREVLIPIKRQFHPEVLASGQVVYGADRRGQIIVILFLAIGLGAATFLFHLATDDARDRRHRELQEQLRVYQTNQFQCEIGWDAERRCIDWTVTSWGPRLKGGPLAIPPGAACPVTLGTLCTTPSCFKIESKPTPSDSW